MKKLKSILNSGGTILFIVFLMLVAGKAIYNNFKHIKTEKRLTHNLHLADQKMKYYKSKHDTVLAQNEILQFRNKEYKKIYPDLKKRLKDFDIRLRNLQSHTKTIVQNNTTIHKRTRDSLVLRYTEIDTSEFKAEFFKYNDPFYNIKGLVIPALDTVTLDIRSITYIEQFVHKGKRTKWWQLWKKRPLVQTIHTRNPKDSVIYNKHVQLTK